MPDPIIAINFLYIVAGGEVRTPLLASSVRFIVTRMSPSTDWYQAQRSSIEGCCRQLVAERVIEPLSTEEGETRSWNLCELASLLEGHLHAQLDVTRLSEEERIAYERRVTYDGHL